MDKLIYVAMSGARNLMSRQDSIANNLANASSNGFKQETMAFGSVATSASERVYGVESNTGADLSPGPIRQTGRKLDVAPTGEAWIAVQGRDGREAYTRNGSLQVGADGILQTASGHAVLGSGGPISIPADTEVTIASDGTVSATLGRDAGGAVVNVGQIKLVNAAPGDLVRRDDGLLGARRGEALNPDVSARLEPQTLEGSNVNMVDALVGMISAARQFETQLKLIQTAEAHDRAASQLLNAGG